MKCEDAFSACIEKGKVVGDCFVFTPDGELIIDSGPNYPFSVERHLDLDHAEQLYSSLPDPVQIDGRVLVLNSFGPWNYYHWTLDIITKLAMVDLSTIDLVWTYSDSSFQQEYLSAFGIGPDKILTAKRVAYWQARELVYTSAHPRRAASVDFLRSTARELFGVELQNEAHRRLYISRRDSAGRHVVNNDEVLECLRPLGFEEIVLSDLGVQEQMQLFADAEFIIGPHGAGLINGIFSRPQTKVIELFSPQLVVPPFYHQLTNAQLNYAFLVGEGDEGGAEGAARFQEPMTISVRKLKALLSQMNVQ